MILGNIQLEPVFLVDDSGHVVHFAHIIVNRVALQRQVTRKPGVAVVDCGSDDVDPENERCEDVSDSPGWDDKRRSDIRDLGP